MPPLALSWPIRGRALAGDLADQIQSQPKLICQDSATSYSGRTKECSEGPLRCVECSEGPLRCVECSEGPLRCVECSEGPLRCVECSEGPLHCTGPGSTGDHL